ncbi:MAG: type transport system permease protein [Mycobacterium sp.]|jgi:ABC-2 type transport system permease protein|nr:type transport system permease protein [Mycobacterium sp.]
MAARLLVVNTWVQTQRLVVRWCRDVETLVFALGLPCFFLVANNQVFGKPVSAVSGHSALYGLVPMAALVGAVFGSAAAGISLMHERDDGLLARFWVLPVHRASDLLSRLAAEVVRILASSVLVAATGVALGFRFGQGIAATLAWFVVPVVFGLAFSFLVTTIALYMSDTVLAESTSIAVAPLFFFCTGFVPLDQYPSWLQPVVAHQPMSYAVETMRGLSLGGPVLSPMIGTLLWAVGIVAACTAPMLIRYRKACTY